VASTWYKLPTVDTMVLASLAQRSRFSGAFSLRFRRSCVSEFTATHRPSHTGAENARSPLRNQCGNPWSRSNVLSSLRSSAGGHPDHDDSGDLVWEVLFACVRAELPVPGLVRRPNVGYELHHGHLDAGPALERPNVKPRSVRSANGERDPLVERVPEVVAEFTGCLRAFPRRELSLEPGVHGLTVNLGQPEEPDDRPVDPNRAYVVEFALLALPGEGPSLRKRDRAVGRKHDSGGGVEADEKRHRFIIASGRTPCPSASLSPCLSGPDRLICANR
jgi:hypothetical protein